MNTTTQSVEHKVLTDALTAHLRHLQEKLERQGFAQASVAANLAYEKTQQEIAITIRWLDVAGMLHHLMKQPK